ncbi:hypothetical protein HMI54_005155 [Coelomomyces lativittatus]|nr:hypothetical protein HMI54_005155 [Coelomomyces lativittatus]
MSSREAYLKKLEGIISKNHHFASSKARETQKLPLTKPQSLEPLRDSPSNLPENNLHASLPSEISKYAILSSPPATEEAVTKNESVTASLPTHVQDKLMTVAVAQNEHDTHSNINPSHFKAQDFTLPVKSLPDSIDISTKKNEGSTQLLSSLTQTNIAPQLNNLVSSNDVHQKEIVLSSTSDHVPQTLSNVSTPKLVNNELNHSLPSTTSLTADKANGISLPVSSNVLNEKEKEKEKEKETKSSVSHFSEIISSDPIVDKNSSKEEKMLNSKEPTNFVKDPVHLVPQAHALLPEDRANEHIQSTSSFVIKKDNSISGNTQDDAENFVKPHSAASVLITEEETVPVKKVSLDKLTESKANSSHIVTSVETVGKKQHLKSVDQLIDESKNKTASSDLKHKSTTAITSITHLASRSTSNNVSSTSDVSAQKSKSKSKQGLMDTLFHKLKSSKPSLSKSNEPEAKTATIQESENITSKNTSIPDIDSQKVAPVIHENQGNKIKAEEVVKDLTADAALNEETGKKERGEDEEMKEIGEEEKDRRVEKENLKDVQETTSQILIDDLKRVISLNSNLTRSNEVTGMINGASENLVKITPITLTSSIDAKTTDSTSSISKAILTPLPTSPVTTSFPSVENTVELTTTTAAMTSSSPLSNLKKSSSMTKVKKVPSHTSVQSVHVSPIATHPKKKDGNHSEPILSSDQFTAKNGSVSKISPTSKQGPPTTTPITKSTPVLNKDSSLISLKATGSKENVRSRGKDGRKNKSHRKSK